MRVMKPDAQPTFHIGIIPDGNRRWCAKAGTTLLGMITEMNVIRTRSLKEIASGNLKSLKKVTHLTMYILTVENLNRKDDTLGMVLLGLKMLLNDIKIKDLTDVQIEFIGERYLLNEEMNAILTEIEELTANPGAKLKIYGGIAYDPILDAKSVVGEVVVGGKTLDMETVGGKSTKGKNNPSQSLRPKQPPIDLVIRTGGELRTSGFFPLHTLYSEWYFSPKLYPEFTFRDIEVAIQEYEKRSRRFGL